MHACCTLSSAVLVRLSVVLPRNQFVLLKRSRASKDSAKILNSQLFEIMDAHSDAAMSIDAAAPAVNGTKKRKHAGAAEGSQSAGKPGPSSLASFAVSDDNVKDALRPLMASLPALALPAETRLSLFTEGGIAAPSKDKGKGKGRASSMLHGESEKLDWHSSNRLFGIQDGGNLGQLDDVYGAAGNDDGECSAAYALALYDPASSTISLVSTPLHIMQHMPKRLRTLSTLAALSEPATSNLAARTALGQEFGTKKAKRAIQAAERNKVDAGAKDLQLVQDVLMENLDAGLTTLPASSPVKGMGPGVSSSVDITALVEMAKKTGMPVPDTTALKAESVYHIFGEIILDKEWEAINPSPVLKTPASDVSQALSRLPFYHSTWINDRVRHLLSPQMADLDKKERSRRLGALLWLSGILAVKSHRGRVDVSSDEQMQKQFRRHSATVTPECMRSLFERFCENIRGTSQ